MDLRVQTYDEVTSTNHLIKEAIAAGEPEGLVVRALRQNAGYGRQGRGWKSPEGGLYCSWLLRAVVPLAQMPTLSLVVGLAVQAACQECVAQLGGLFGGNTIAVKWPNDVVVVTEGESGFKKLCGISTEVVQGAVCVGVGINVCSPRLATTPEAAERVPFYLSSFCRPDRSTLFEKMSQQQALDHVFDLLAGCFVSYYERWVDEGFLPFSQDFNERNVLGGRFVELVNSNGDAMQQGVVLGVNPDGTLCLQQLDGAEVAVSSGEAHVLLS